ncbi:MAG: hypothetical protein ABR518_05415, partial [Actinomycetota bacterium]
ASPARLVARGAEAVGNLASDALGDGLSAAAYALFLGLFAWVVVRMLRPSPADNPAAVWAVALLALALSAPYLLPWYVAAFIPILPLVAERRFVVIGLVAAALLALTGIPAEPRPDPGLWRGMILGVHYVVAPVMLALLVLLVRAVPPRPFQRRPDRVANVEPTADARS